MKVSSKIELLSAAEQLRVELIDYVELAVYAAAEHVNDIDSIAFGFFMESKDCKNSKAYKDLRKEVNRLKRAIAISANAIKHQQARIRLFSIEMTHAQHETCLHGYFVEGVQNGVIGPNCVLHRSQDCFSLTSLAWEIIAFLLGCSRALYCYLIAIGQRAPELPAPNCSIFNKAVSAAARLPLYTFGEEHPFTRVTLLVGPLVGEGATTLESDLYGSILTRWDVSAVPSFGRFHSSFVGDGVSKSFRFAQPKQVSLMHWS